MSNYSNYLISDLIQFLSEEKEEKINVQFVKVNLKSHIIFYHKILNTLISVNTLKRDNILSYFEYDEIIENLDIYSDEVRLNQIMLNLISNAVKFTNNGYILISCKYNEDLEEIHLSIIDTGSGIKEEDKQLVFNDNNNE